MKITGYAIREAIKQQELRRDTASRTFADTLKVFPGEEKDSPETVVAAFLTAEKAIARLQTAQARYNILVTLDVPGAGTLTLSEAIKTIGGISRAEKMWRSVVGPKQERYGYNSDQLDPNMIQAKPTLTSAKAVALASIAAKAAGRLRAAIAVANSREVDIQDLTPELFE